MTFTRRFAMVLTVWTMAGSSFAQAADARKIAESITFGDDRYMVIRKVGDEPRSAEAGRYLSLVDMETMTFRVGLRDQIIVRLMAGHVVSVETKRLNLWD